MTSDMPTDGPLLVLMLNVLKNLTSDGVMSWHSNELMHFLVEVGLLLLLILITFVTRVDNK